MTDAERQRNSRWRRGIGGPVLPAWRPWDGERANRQETKVIDEIENFLQYGDIESVTKWLAHFLVGRDEEPTEFLRKLSDTITFYGD